jgi:hypothetical protein
MWANMMHVSNVAHGPLVYNLAVLIKKKKRYSCADRYNQTEGRCWFSHLFTI